MEEAFAIAQATGQPEALDVYSTQLVHVRYAQGRFHELRDAVIAVDLDRPHPLPRPFAAWALAELDEPARARAALTLALADAPRLRDDDFKLVAMGYAAMATASLADADAARTLIPLLAPYANQWGNTGAVVMPATAELLHQLEGIARRPSTAK
jgi:hypothetical protein